MPCYTDNIVKLLICDDDLYTRKAIESVFDIEQFETKSVDSAIEAIQAIKTSPFDLVLMDIDMPELNGIEAIKTIQAFKKDQKVIIITGHKLTDVMSSAYRHLNVYDIIEKPFDIEYLRGIVDEALL